MTLPAKTKLSRKEWKEEIRRLGNQLENRTAAKPA